MSKNIIISLVVIILQLTVNFSVAAQDITVGGTVYNPQEDEPVIGAAVIVKGSNVGTATDINGNFSINASKDAILVISGFGFDTVEVAINGRTHIDIELKASSEILDEVVVIGYGVQKKSDVTGSISSVSGKDLNNVPVASALQALQGKASGVNIIQNSGAPGGATTIKIRGTGTINDADPLYVVDGFIVDDITHINPNDIANIEILKDAASSAVYGARAANGVVAITTKGGEKGKVSVTFDGYVGFSNPWKEINVMNTEEYALMRDYVNGTSVYSADGRIYNTKNPDGSFIFDDHKKFLVDTIRANSPKKWWDAITRTGIKQQYNLAVSGGNDNTKYMVSGSYYNEKGIVKSSDYARFNVRMNLQQKLANWLDFIANLSYSNEDRDLIPDGSSSVLKRVLNQNPMVMTYNSVGYWTEDHPLAQIARFHRNVKRDRFDGNITLSANFLRFFNYQFKASYYVTPETTNQFTEVNSLETDFLMTDLSTIYKYKTHTNKWEINNLLTFNWNNSIHSVTALAGQTAEGYSFSTQESTKKGTASNDPSQWYLSSGFTGDKNYGYDRKWTAVGFIGRVNYNLLDRYLLQANIRVDGSSKFSKNNRWGYFPSVSLGWKFSSESFLRDNTWLTLGKLRVGWGKLGNNRIDELARYTYLTSQLNYAYGQGTHILQPGSAALTLGNDNIKWEKTETYNVGLDLAFLNNKILFGVEYFNKRTTDMLLAVPTVPSVGLDVDPMTNAGAVKNYGVETQLTYRNSFGKFSFDVGFNFSWIKNKVTSLGTGNEPIYGSYLGEGSIQSDVTKTAVGRPIGSFYGYVTDGIFQSYDEVKASAQYEPGKMDSEQTTRPGDFRFKDLNGDGKITADDRTYLGSPLPDFVFGVPINLQYDGFSLSLFFQGQTGNKIFNVMDYYLYNAAEGNCYADLREKHWSGQISEPRAFYPLNTNNEVPDLDPNDAARNFRASDFLVKDGSYLRLKEVRFSYTFPQSKIAKLGLSSLTLSATAYNMLTFTKYDGFDPEVGKVTGSEGNNLSMGVDHGNYPQARSFSFGLKFGF
ncbi:TonB-dependent receptor [Muribaculaceae bacterium Isolate-037 (Harlan)]|jgi:TonB-linked SusC/RagA family outer membrane protein|nr:TonB-dependent receptor [Muribaculaceae bacterium Isolate-037 (Harlan)]